MIGNTEVPVSNKNTLDDELTLGYMNLLVNNLIISLKISRVDMIIGDIFKIDILDIFQWLNSQRLS